MTERIKTWWAYLWDFINSQMIVRRLLLAMTLYLTWDSYVWCKQFAQLSKWDALGTAAVIAAVATPATLLLKWVLENYSENRK